MFRKISKIAFLAIILTTLFDQAVSGQTEKFETRCGWFENPTPANYSLYDREAEWIFGVQGGYQLENFEIPVFKKGQWVEAPVGSYGYGCACFEMLTDAETNHVLEIKKSVARPLAACRRDKALKKKWKFEL